MSDRKTCFFIGHREADERILPALQEAVLRHITEYGVKEFVVGYHGGFDRLAAFAVKEAKKAHPDVMLTLLLAYHPAERPIPVPEGFDSTFYPPGMETVPRRYCISKANQYMANHGDYLIAYAWHPASNAKTLADAILRKGRMRVTLLPKETHP